MSSGPAGGLLAHPVPLTCSHVVHRNPVYKYRACFLCLAQVSRFVVRALTHVWRGKIMTMLCVRNNARGRAILVERLLLVDTGICVSLVIWSPLCLCRLKCHSMWISFYELFTNRTPNKVLSFFGTLLWGCLDRWEGWLGGGMDGHTGVHGYRWVCRWVGRWIEYWFVVIELQWTKMNSKFTLQCSSIITGGHKMSLLLPKIHYRSKNSSNRNYREPV